MNANRKSKDSLLDFAELWDYDMSPCRFGSKEAQAKKRCEDTPHSKSTPCETAVVIGVNQRDSRAEKIFASRDDFRLSQYDDADMLFKQKETKAAKKAFRFHPNTVFVPFVVFC